jgi:hypothetical protein
MKRWESKQSILLSAYSISHVTAVSPALVRKCAQLFMSGIHSDVGNTECVVSRGQPFKHGFSDAYQVI